MRPIRGGTACQFFPTHKQGSESAKIQSRGRRSSAFRLAPRESAQPSDKGGNLTDLFEGVVSTSRADTASMQSPCRAKRLYKCTASAGEESKDTELFGEEKQQRVTNLFQSVKTYKSQ